MNNQKKCPVFARDSRSHLERKNSWQRPKLKIRKIFTCRHSHIQMSKLLAPCDKSGKIFTCRHFHTDIQALRPVQFWRTDEDIGRWKFHLQIISYVRMWLNSQVLISWHLHFPYKSYIVSMLETQVLKWPFPISPTNRILSGCETHKC